MERIHTITLTNFTTKLEISGVKNGRPTWISSETSEGFAIWSSNNSWIFGNEYMTSADHVSTIDAPCPTAVLPIGHWDSNDNWGIQSVTCEHTGGRGYFKCLLPPPSPLFH